MLIAAARGSEQPTHDPRKTDTGDNDSLQSISPVVDQDLVLVVRLINDLSVWPGGDSVWLHVPERTARQFIGSYLFLLSPLRTERQAVVRAGHHHQPPAQSPQSGVSLVFTEKYFSLTFNSQYFISQLVRVLSSNIWTRWWV